jgi:aldehyde dehydrogenase (NAD+)
MLIGPGRSKIVAEPLGVVLVLGSWNFPLFTTLGPLIDVIAAGNCAVIKGSEISLNTSRKMKQLITRYLDMSCYVCIEGAVQVAISLTSKKFDSIIYTGSSEKGKLVAASAAKNLVPCILELGGKSPCIVDESADLEHAAKKIVFGRFVNAGQVCLAPDYLLVHEKVLDKLVPLLKKYIKEFWADGKNVEDMGTIVNDFHTKRVCDLIRDHRS